MIIDVIELCETENGQGFRLIRYKTKADNLKDATVEYENDFDFDNMVLSEDFFSGECLDMTTLKIIAYDDTEDSD